MRRLAVTCLLALVGALCAAQTTTLEFVSAAGVPVFQVERVFVEDGGSLTRDVDVTFSSMKLAGLAPFALEVENGAYVFNAGGFEEYNKTFFVEADGTPLRIAISGDARKAKTWNLWTVGTAAAFVLSLDLVATDFANLSQGENLWTLAFPAVAGAGFGISLASWLGQIPRVTMTKIR